jgi:uncharacterized tellurite resistance protein B-like protein
MTRYDLFRNLMVMAVCDGQLTEEEVTMLAQRANKWEISDAEFSQAMRYAMSTDAVITIPGNKGERRQLLAAMLRMIGVDGEMADIEKNLFAVAAGMMRISDEELNSILDDVLKSKK